MLINGLYNMMKKIYVLILMTGMVFTNYSCKQKSYPCPGLGQSSEADLSKFDDKGELKDGKGKKGGPTKRVNHETGMVNKKNPKQIKAPRKTHL